MRISTTRDNTLTLVCGKAKKIAPSANVTAKQIGKDEPPKTSAKIEEAKIEFGLSELYEDSYLTESVAVERRHPVRNSSSSSSSSNNEFIAL